MEGTEACLGTSSGMAAILVTLMALLKAGDHVLCSHSVFGSTIKLFQDFAKFGVETSFVSQTDVGAWRAAMRPNTRLLFAESPTNPLTEVCDIAALAEVAATGGYCCPEITDPSGPEARLLQIEAGRHPVVEQLLVEEPFTANSVVLGPTTPPSQ